MPSGNPSAAKRLKCTVNVGSMLDTCNELPTFLADGLFEFLKDHKCLGDTRRDAPPAYKGKGGVVAAYRLLCKDVRVCVDARIVKEFASLHAAAVMLREQYLRSKASAAVKPVSMIREMDEPLAEASKTFMNQAEALFNNSLANSIRYDITVTGKNMFVNIIPDVPTFMAMVTERCQLHGGLPVGQKGSHCRNMCNGGGDNFSIITCGEQRQCIYARQKCLDSLCVNFNPRLLSHGENTVSYNTARAMFRKKGVMPPYRTEEVHEAMVTGGHFSRPPGTMGSNWAKKIFLRSHPLVKMPSASIQGILGLTDKQVSECASDAIRKQMQKKNREKSLIDLDVKDLAEDVDSELTSKDLPFKSLKDLQDTMPAAARMFEIVMRKEHSVKHAMDIEGVRNGLETMDILFKRVSKAQSESGHVSSSEAYEFVFGLHVSKYTDSGMEWGRHYFLMDKGTLMLKNGTVSDICQALVMFDELDKDSLVVSKRRNHDDLPEKYSLFTKTSSITFNGPIYDWDARLALHNDINGLAQREELDTSLPKLYTKRTHGDVYNHAIGGNKQVKEVNTYINGMFKATVEDYGTRCSSLDLLKLTPERIVKAFAERRVEKEGGPLCEILPPAPRNQPANGPSSSGSYRVNYGSSTVYRPLGASDDEDDWVDTDREEVYSDDE